MVQAACVHLLVSIKQLKVEHVRPTHGGIGTLQEVGYLRSRRRVDITAKLVREERSLKIVVPALQHFFRKPREIFRCHWLFPLSNPARGRPFLNSF
jgi:hypothetical protein